MLSNTILKKSVAFLEAEIFRFFMLQLATNTLYIFSVKRKCNSILHKWFSSFQKLQAQEVLLIVGEEGSTIHCCWLHDASLNGDRIMRELHNYFNCAHFLDTIEYVHSLKCTEVEMNQIARVDLPPANTVHFKAECTSLSKHVKIIRDEYGVTCDWIASHFDMGFNARLPEEMRKNGLLNSKICKKLHEDCEVGNRHGSLIVF